jgi:hypothetical protein
LPRSRAHFPDCCFLTSGGLRALLPPREVRRVFVLGPACGLGRRASETVGDQPAAPLRYIAR